MRGEKLKKHINIIGYFAVYFSAQIPNILIANKVTPKDPKKPKTHYAFFLSIGSSPNIAYLLWSSKKLKVKAYQPLLSK